MAHCSSNPITLPITTRAIGFSCANLFSQIRPLQIRPAVPDNIYQLYRVGLALISAKIESLSYWAAGTEKYFTTLSFPFELIDVLKGRSYPDLLAYVIDSIGNVETMGRRYVPRIGRNNTTPEGLFIPQSEQVTYDNLREVVISLSNGDTPLEYRLQFYKNNPIPGAIWKGAPDNPILCNADEIIPEEYTMKHLFSDIRDVSNLMNVLESNWKKTFFRRSNPRINFDRRDGHMSMLVCNDQGTLRVCDRRSEENLNDYYRRITIEGKLNDFSSLEDLTEKQQVIGCYTLLGERPNVESLIYPVYTTRLSRICPFRLPITDYFDIQISLRTY